MRKIIIVFLLVLVFFYYLHLFFIQGEWFYSIVFLLIVFCLLHYFFIEFQQQGTKYFTRLILGGTLLGGIFLRNKNIYFILALFAMGLGVVFLMWSINNEISNRKTLYSRSIFNSGNTIFGLFMAISYASIFIGQNNQFTLTCTELYQRSEQFIDFVSKPLTLGRYTVNLGMEKLSATKDKIQQLGSMSIQEFVGIDSGTVHQNVNIPSTLSGGETGQIDHSILGQIELLKMSIVDQVIKDKKNVDQGVCSYIITQIKEKYNQQGFKISVLVPLFFLLWPFAGIILFLTGMINFLLFQLLRFTKIYEYKNKTDQVEYIE